MRKKIVAGNWKMNCDLPTSQKLIWELKKALQSDYNCELMIAPSFPCIYPAFKSTLDTPLEVIAQNCCAYEKGAYTGETSVDILQSVGVKTVIIGHSERRDIYQENNDVIAQKVNYAVSKGMRILLCCGEQLEQRQAGQHFEIISTQLQTALQGINAAQMEQIVIAYEPVWAIGTGETASPDQAQEMHAHIRKLVENIYDSDIANDTSILYGGSVKPSNAAQLFNNPDVDGALVGGASLDADSFLAIAHAI